jgi:phytanoyl-CoA hydroxylase
MNYQLSPDQIAAFRRDGYLIVPRFFSTEENSLLLRIATQDETLKSHAYDVKDETGKNSRLTLWFTPGEDIYGLVSRSERMVHGADALLEGDSAVCHYHSKLMQKEPRVGGAWEWHQDYGYWYKNEFLYPDQMVSVMVAITPARKENGCLQVIRGSHKMGRVEHGKAGEQVGASAKYVELALRTMELVYVELEEGDALFFHSNLLHRSEANLSEHSRWSLISVYNRQSNVPFNEPSKSCVTALKIVPDREILEKKASAISDDAGFLSKEADITLKD